MLDLFKNSARAKPKNTPKKKKIKICDIINKSNLKLVDKCLKSYYNGYM